MSSLEPQISASVDSLAREILSFTQRLVQTASLPGKEQKAQAIVSAKLNEIGMNVETVESRYDALKAHPAFCDDGIPFDKRINVVGRWPGARRQHDSDARARSLILNGHIDVVPVGNEDLWEESPWSGMIKDGKLYGRGSCDMKSGLACAIFAIEALQTLGFKPQKDVLVESVIGEETGGIGTLTTIIHGYTADAAIVMEPTGLALCPVQAGALTFRIKVTGRSVHACAKKSGVSAIEKFYTIVNLIKERGS